MVDLTDVIVFFFFNDTATTEIYTLSLHDALPIFSKAAADRMAKYPELVDVNPSLNLNMPELQVKVDRQRAADIGVRMRSEEHTSELQSRLHLVCRLLLEKKNTHSYTSQTQLVKRT